MQILLPGKGAKYGKAGLILVDTSTLIELFTKQTFNALCLDVYIQAPHLGACTFALTETLAVLHALQRGNFMARADMRSAVRQVEAAWPTFLTIGTSRPVLNQAAKLIKKHPIKAGDAVHLAAAMGLYKYRKDIAFFTIDRGLYKISRLHIPVVEVPQFK